MYRLISISCDPASEELDTCVHKLGHGVGDGGLEALDETAVSPHPGEAAPHHPAQSQDFEACHVIASHYDLQPPLAGLFQCLVEFRSGVGTIGEDVAQPGEGPLDRCEQRRRTVAVYRVWAA